MRERLVMACPLCSGCWFHAGAFYQCLGETTREVLSCSTCLTVWVTHDPFTAVRATTSLGGERAHLTMLILSPLTGFLSRSLFHNSPLSCGEQANFTFPTISADRFYPLAFCAALWKRAAWHVTWRGMGKEESGGLGEKTRKGKEDCSRAAPLSPGCLPKTSVNRSCVSGARRKNKTTCKENGH